jgi:chemotaxis protein methyltransferase CheR
MMKTDSTIGTAEVTRFAELIEERLGLQYASGSSLIELETILQARMRALQCHSFDIYVERLESAASMHEELRELAAKLTIGETYFFRSPEQLNVFSQLALPRLTQTDPARHIRILSAGCSSGEEPYTIAMTLLELGRRAPAAVSILALDINPEALTIARRGRYSAWAMRATPPDRVEKYFRRDGSQFVLEERVKAKVRFEERNIAHDDPQFWQPRRFDVVFCRNVIMYLSARVLGEVIARFARALTPDGFLFLSHAEPLRGISPAFHVEHAEGAFFYVLRKSVRAPVGLGSIAPGSSARKETARPLIPSLLREGTTAARVLSASSRRSGSFQPASLSCTIAGPAAAAEPAPPPLGAVSPSEKGASLSLGAALMRAEQYDEALATLQALASADRLDPDVLLMTAIIQVERGKLEEAAELCTSLLALDGLNAAAHYLTALCHEHGGRRAAAIDSYRVGVYLDSAFAMPHLRLGLMFRHDGDLPGARRELQNASMLLAQEDPARVLLFGGGFSRSTLIDLCASELRLCEERN